MASPQDVDRLELLDRIEHRLPGLHLDKHSVEWTTLPDGSEALVVDGGGFDGGNGCFFANHGPDLHVIGTLDQIVDDHIGCIVIKPDGSRYVARAVPDPLGREDDT